MPAISIRPDPAGRRLCRLPIRAIRPNPWQPRQAFDPESIQTLADSIRQHGLLSPLLVRQTGGDFELIAGERRLQAMQHLGWTHADAIVIAASDRDCALMGLIENLQREDIHYLDEAQACRRILREHDLTQEELAASLGKSPSTLANRLRLLKLGRDVRAFIRESSLSERHARALLKQSDDDIRLLLAQRAAGEGLSVRQLEALVEESLRHRKPTAPRQMNPLIRDNRLVINALKDTVRKLKKIGVPVSSRVETRGEVCEIIVTIRQPQQ